MISESISVMANAMALSAASDAAYAKSMADSFDMIAHAGAVFLYFASISIFIWAVGKLVESIKNERHGQ